ncbi:MAG: fumarylacetoacetate hydrolase family protein [Alphaproteobacteria bacterium]|nr:fumarylacetoacetate hydrolase family protein [Alphaproteobacteria bacterium]
MTIDLQRAIEEFSAARARGECFPADYFDRLSLDEAYHIQLALIDRRCAAGERQIGWKVGLTSKAIQEQFGFHEPCFGCILESRPSGHVFAPGELIRPGFETELCVRLGRPLAGEVSMEEVQAAAAVVYPSFEITETRGDPTQIALMMADNAQQRSVILGEPVELAPALRLDQVEARVELNGSVVATGAGAAVLDHPLNSVAWLARKLGAYGRSLQVGDVVMTGSMVRQFPLSPGDRAWASFSDIGTVEVRVA